MKQRFEWKANCLSTTKKKNQARSDHIVINVYRELNILYYPQYMWTVILEMLLIFMVDNACIVLIYYNEDTGKSLLRNYAVHPSYFMYRGDQGCCNDNILEDNHQMLQCNLLLEQM